MNFENDTYVLNSTNNNELVEFSIVSVLGKSVTESKSVKLPFVIETTEMHKGVYFIKIQQGNNDVEVVTFIVN